MKIPSNDFVSCLNQDRFPFPDSRNEGKMRLNRIKTHAKFTIDNVDEAAEDNDEVEAVPRITKVILVIPKVSKERK